MELIYKGKQTIKEILQHANSINVDIVKTSNSMFLFGDNFIGLSALIKAGYANKIDLVYIDPPFNTKQNFTISNERKNTISRSKQGIIAYTDIRTKENFIEFIRERVVLIRELLSEEGSLYFHIDYKIGHYIKLILDEIFGSECFLNDITRIKSNPKNFSRRAYGNEKDLILFYAKNPKKHIFNDIRIPLTETELISKYKYKDNKGYYTTIPLHAPGESNGITGTPWRGISPPVGRHWRTDPKEFDILDNLGMIAWSKTGNPRIKKYALDNKGKKIQDIWKYKDPPYPKYPTEKNIDMLDMIIKMSSNPNSIIMDCFAGSGTTLVAAQKNNRIAIGMDNSDIALEIINNQNLKNIKFINLKKLDTKV